MNAKRRHRRRYRLRGVLRRIDARLSKPDADKFGPSLLLQFLKNRELLMAAQVKGITYSGTPLRQDSVPFKPVNLLDVLHER